ncbi:hypothetical protein DFH07DRAFT_974617 [Mycena maculata]|uniref:Ribonuclease H1 N-terminal domain-containing protein n=1 Tax=Mycena maculata TaxID=230809 RepID=A0AAD7H7E9_9AGAR|nr:hypothetical protein DFH07DRAFT_974617 [Mycena maculata]
MATPSQIVDLLRLQRAHLSGVDLEHLTEHLTDHQFEEVADLLGLTALARDTPPVFLKVVLAAQRIARDSPPEYPDEIDELISNFKVSLLDENLGDSRVATPPPSSPKPPTTPVAARTSRSTPATPRTRTRHTVNWLEAGALTQGVRGSSARRVKNSSRKKKPAGAYIVFYGSEVGVFREWADTKASTTGHGLAIFSGFPTVQAATAALEYARAKGWTADLEPLPATSSPLPSPDNYADNPLNIGAAGSNIWYAVARGVTPGVYRSFLECGLNVSGIPGSLHCAFESREEAEAALTEARRAGFVRTIPRVVPL